MEILTNLEAYLYVPGKDGLINQCFQAQAFTDAKGYQIYEFLIGLKDAIGQWGEEVEVIFKGRRMKFKIAPFDKSSGMKYTASFRYGKFDHQYYFRVNV